jgi:hypothetical protein
MTMKKNVSKMETIKLFWHELRISRKLIIKIAILAICITTAWIFILKSDNTEDKIKEAQALQIFLKLDDIAHESIANWRKRWESYASWHELFYVIDNNFHSAKTIKEKYKYAKEMDKFMHEMDVYIDKSWLLDTAESKERDRKYDETDMLFDEIIK